MTKLLKFTLLAAAVLLPAEQAMADHGRGRGRGWGNGKHYWKAQQKWERDAWRRGFVPYGGHYYAPRPVMVVPQPVYVYPDYYPPPPPPIYVQPWAPAPRGVGINVWIGR